MTRARMPAPADLRQQQAAAIEDDCARRDADDRAALERARQPRGLLLTLADAERRPVDWLWPGRIPLGKLTMIAGHPGLGKSMLTLALAAAVTRGSTLPNFEGRAVQGRVIILSAEDGAEDTLAPRFDAAGGDDSMVHLLYGVLEPNKQERELDLARDLGILRDTVQSVGDVRLIIIDPISAYLGDTDENSNAKMRGGVLKPLARLAQEAHAAVLLVSHLRKGATGSAQMRAIGSIAGVAACRVAWGVTEDPDDRRARLWLQMKNNLSEPQVGLRYGLTVPPEHDVPTVAWAGTTDVSADEVMGQDDAQDRGEGSTRSEARDWLREQLADGPVASKKLKQRAKADGLAWRTVERAKADLRVRAMRMGFADNAGWAWSLPETEDCGAYCSDRDEEM